MQLDPGMLGQPGTDRRVLVGGEVVHHHMQLAARVGRGDLLEEGQELAVAMLLVAPVGHLAGGRLQRREQRRDAVPDAVVGALLGPPGRTGRAGWVRPAAWISVLEIPSAASSKILAR
jgi:hypothetical protein